MIKETFNIIVKCDSEEDREEVLNTINDGLSPLDTQTLYERKIIRYGKESNVYFSENDESMPYSPGFGARTPGGRTRSPMIAERRRAVGQA